MLHSYTFANYQSFRQRTAVSFLLGKKAPARGWERTSLGGQRTSTALAVFGANAAGKTALLKPLVFASWFINHSFAWAAEAPIPFTPHFASPEEPFEIEIDAEDDEGVLWRYALRATTKRVLHESLHRKHKRFIYLFTRDWNEASHTYEIKQKGLGLATSEAKKVRQNASLLSTAAQYGVDVDKYLGVFSSVTTNTNYFGRLNFHRSHLHEASEFFAGNEDLQEKMVDLLRRWDIGLSDVKLHEVDQVQKDGTTKKIWASIGVHETREGESIELPMELESSGTQSAFVLLSRLLASLATGDVAVIDEMENDLHPLLVEHILDLFSSPESNPLGAQVIFTCHSPGILDVLQKAQVIFVEKDSCESEAYRGDEIEGLRSDDNLRAKYEAGALGGIPRI